MTNYKKMQNADLETLLKLRGLSTDGTKTQRVGRLAMQDKEDEAEAKAIDARVKAASTSTPTDNASDHGTQVGRGPGPGPLHRRSGGQVRRLGTRKGKGKSTFGDGAAEARTHEGQAGKENAKPKHDQEAYIKSLLGANDDPGPAKKSTSPGIFVNMTPNLPSDATKSATPDFDTPISRKEVAFDGDADLNTNDDSNAASKVIIFAFFISAIAMLILHGFALDDLHRFMLGVKAWVQNPVHAMKEAIFGELYMHHPGTLETVGDRVRKLTGIICGIMRVGWEELVENMKGSN